MNKLAVGLMVALVGVLLFPAAHGADFQIKPYLGVRGAYNDNIFLDPNSNEAVDDYILTTLPGIELTNRTERLDVRLSGEVAPYFFNDNSDLNFTDQDYRGRIGYQLSPRFYSEADAFFIVDHRPDRDFLATGLVQTFEKRDRYHFGGGLRYNISEKDAVNLDYDFNRDDWEKEADLEDVNFYGLNLGLDRNLADWLRETDGQLTIGYNRIKRDSAETDSFVAEVGLEYRLSELFSLQLRGGARYVSSDFDVLEGTDPATGAAIIGKESDSGWGGVGAAILGYNGEKTTGNLIVSHDLSPGSGRGTPTVLTRAIGAVNYRFLETMRFGLRAGIFRNKADSGDFGFEEIDQYTYSIRPNIRWEFYDNFTLEAAYRYYYIENRVSDRTALQNTVYLELAYGLPLFDFFDVSGVERRQIVSGAVPIPDPAR